MPQSQLNTLPNYPVPLITGGNTGRDWYRFFAGIFQGLPPANVQVPVVGASPYSYSAVRRGSLIVQGGTVSAIEFSRDGTDFYDVGATSGMFALNASDVLRITYSVLPNVTFVPS